MNSTFFNITALNFTLPTSTVYNDTVYNSTGNATHITVQMLYGYDPNVQLAMATFILYLIAISAVTFLTIFYRYWNMIILSLAGFGMTCVKFCDTSWLCTADCMGFFLRVRCVQDNNTIYYMGSTLLILVCPTIAAISSYGNLSRL